MVSTKPKEENAGYSGKIVDIDSVFAPYYSTQLIVSEFEPEMNKLKSDAQKPSRSCSSSEQSENRKRTRRMHPSIVPTVPDTVPLTQHDSDNGNITP